MDFTDETIPMPRIGDQAPVCTSEFVTSEL